MPIYPFSLSEFKIWDTLRGKGVLEGEIQIGPVMEVQEDSAGAQTGPKEAALEDLILKSRCMMQSATNAAKNAKFLSGHQEKSRFTAAAVLEKMKDLNQEILKGLNQVPLLKTIQSLKE